MYLRPHISSDERPFHSNVYAKVARGNALGAMSLEPFSTRLKREYTPRTVGRYNDSLLSRGPLERPRLQVTERPESPEKPKEQPRTSTASSRVHTTFQEPRSRGYDPYKG